MRTFCLSACLLLASCAAPTSDNPFRPGATGGGGLSRNSGPVEVLVVSNAFLDMHVYAVQAGQTRSLGMVTGLSEVSLTLPRQMVEAGREVRILADPIGGFTAFATDPMLVFPGQRIRLTIQNNLNLSSWWVEDP